MGYETQLQFIEVCLRPQVAPDFVTAVDALLKNPTAEFCGMLDCLRLDIGGGYLDWNMDEKGRREIRKNCGESPVKLSPKELAAVDCASVEFWWDGDMMPIGKWHLTEDLVAWLAPYCSSGLIVQISQEGDGGVWGWQFSERRGIRELGLVPTTKWFHPVLKRRRKPAKSRKRKVYGAVQNGVS